MDKSAAAQLRSFVERIERIEEAISERQEDRKEIYAEAKGAGFDAKAIREIVRLRKQDKADREEREAILDLYKGALGMLSDTPLGEYAARMADEQAAQRKAGDQLDIEDAVAATKPAPKVRRKRAPIISKPAVDLPPLPGSKLTGDGGENWTAV